MGYTLPVGEWPATFLGKNWIGCWKHGFLHQCESVTNTGSRPLPTPTPVLIFLFSPPFWERSPPSRKRKINFWSLWESNVENSEISQKRVERTYIYSPPEIWHFHHSPEYIYPFWEVATPLRYSLTILRPARRPLLLTHLFSPFSAKKSQWFLWGSRESNSWPENSIGVFFPTRPWGVLKIVKFLKRESYNRISSIQLRTRRLLNKRKWKEIRPWLPFPLIHFPFFLL